MTLEGASPRRCGAPVALAQYYPYRYYNGIASAPAPLGGRAGARGGEFLWERRFLRFRKNN
jgi:hypothetical protein